MKIAWAAAARDDRRRITAWLAERNKAAAVRIARALVAATDSLVALPEKGRPGQASDTRELSIVPPYVIIYRVDRAAGVVRILRIWHTSQDRQIETAWSIGSVGMDAPMPDCGVHLFNR